MNDFENILRKYEKYVIDRLIPVIKRCGEWLEGNIMSVHLNVDNLDERLVLKRQNICCLLLSLEGKQKVLEIGFNSGYSALLMLMSKI
jgi:hypothetical protein